MKYLVTIATIIFLSACSTSPKSRITSLDYNKILSLQLGKTTESEVVSSFGSYTEKIQKDGYYTLTYVDAKTGFQRVSLNFSSANNVLTGFLWLPHPGDKQTALSEAKLSFREANFKEVKSEESNPHIASNVVSLVDEKSGITIRYDKKRDFVEGIAKYDVNNRIPANSTKQNIPYSLGNKNIH